MGCDFIVPLKSDYYSYYNANITGNEYLLACILVIIANDLIRSCVYHICSIYFINALLPFALVRLSVLSPKYHAIVQFNIEVNRVIT